jgi:hypothetical protein
MNRVQNISRAPDYINKFIDTNLKDLLNIYHEGSEHFKEGCLVFQCSKETNTMDVQFWGNEQMCVLLEQQSWEQLKKNIPQDKKLFFVNDKDQNSIFLIYI